MVHSNQRRKRHVPRWIAYALAATDQIPLFAFLICSLPSLATLVLLHLLRSPSNPLQMSLFDSSSALLQPGIPSDSAIIRWDAIHFLAIAQNGYEYEQQAAFQPGLPGLLRLISTAQQWVSELVGSVGDGGDDTLKWFGAVAVLVSGLRTVSLFRWVRSPYRRIVIIPSSVV